MSTYCGTFYEAFLDLGVPNRLKREGIVVWHPSKDLKISQIGRLPNPSRINDLLDLAWIIGCNGVHFSSKRWGGGTVQENGFNAVILDDFSKLFPIVPKWLPGLNFDV